MIPSVSLKGLIHQIVRLSTMDPWTTQSSFIRRTGRSWSKTLLICSIISSSMIPNESYIKSYIKDFQIVNGLRPSPANTRIVQCQTKNRPGLLVQEIPSSNLFLFHLVFLIRFSHLIKIFYYSLDFISVLSGFHEPFRPDQGRRTSVEPGSKFKLSFSILSILFFIIF